MQSPDSLRERIHAWRLGVSVDGEAILRGVLCGVLLVVFALLQTTLFSRVQPFGVTPDLILPLVVAVAMTFRERWGAVFGLVAAFVIESLGGAPLTLLPLLYMPTGYVVGLCATYSFRDSLAVRALYTLVTSALRTAVTLIALAATVGAFDLVAVTVGTLLPEFCVNLVGAVLPHAAARLLLRPVSHERT